MKNIVKKSTKVWHSLFLHVVVIGVVMTANLICGCGVENTDGHKVRDLQYEIVEEDQLPDELKTKIEEKKAADFKLVYESDDSMYIVRGYGEQETGGYSIQIQEFYLTENAILFKTGLMGPAKDELKSAAPSYPYVVIKTENLDKNVVFK